MIPTVERVFSRMLSEGSLLGAQYLAVTATERLVDLHCGVRDAATKTPLEPSTAQMAYSVTKAVTVVATLQLAHARGLSLDEPLSERFSAHPYGRGPTVRQLLAHTAGVPSPVPLRWFSIEGETLDRDARLSAVLRAHPRLVAAPGSRFRYSNLGYWLLEKWIEVVAGVDFASYVRAHVLTAATAAGEPAGFDLPAPGRLATGHAARFRPTGLVLRTMTPGRYWAGASGAWRRAARVVPHGRGYGGLFCSARALAPVLADLLRPTPRLLPASLREEMLAAQRDPSGAEIAPGLGWVRGALGGLRYHGKQGGGLGFHGNVRLYPEAQVATVFLANVTEVQPGPIDRRSDELDRWIATRGAP